MTRTVAIVDETKTARPDPAFLVNVASVLTTQASAFCLNWSIRHDVRVVAGPVPGAMVMHLLDDADVQGALGYHDATSSGLPEAFVFAHTILANRGTWSSGPDSVSACMSHELLELLLDLEANEFVFDGGRRMWAKEACDAVEMRSYAIQGVAVSDYVLPAYFTPGAHGPYDKLNVLAHPFTIDRGGYSIVSQAGAESQVFGDGARLVPDEHGSMAVALGPDYPEWRRNLKAAGVSRTMRRLELGHPC